MHLGDVPAACDTLGTSNYAPTSVPTSRPPCATLRPPKALVRHALMAFGLRDLLHLAGELEQRRSLGDETLLVSSIRPRLGRSRPIVDACCRSSRSRMQVLAGASVDGHRFTGSTRLIS